MILYHDPAYLYKRLETKNGGNTLQYYQIQLE